MIKKITAILLSLVILFTACTSNGDKGAFLWDTKANAKDSTILTISDTLNYSNEEIPFSLTPYTPSIPKYTLNSDLSNVVNASKFDGLSQEQIKMLVDNGFVVLNPNPDKAHYYMKMYDIYEENEYKNIPNFITVDVALHMYHKFFDETLKAIEKEHLYGDLQELTDNMFNKAVKLYNEENDKETKKVLGNIVVYFSVANKLINDSYGDIPEEYIQIAKEEINLIEAAQGYVKSPLFDYDVNYEEFIVRGHYTGDEILEPYFRTMIWYGLTAYPLEDENGKIDYDSTKKALAMTYILLFNEDGSNDIVLWDKIYSPTNLFVGQSDDIGILEIKELMINVYGNEISLEKIMDKKYKNKLEDEIKKLSVPQIQYKLITGAVDTPSKKQFRFMGQRYTLDANIMQELMFPIIRPVPTGLDVAGAFGNERAEFLAKEYYLKDLDEKTYTSKLNELKNKVNSLKIEDWQKNLYSGWLWVLESLWTKDYKDEGYPIFMQNQAWEDKTISTGLGSYAELKHDTVLYTKSPVAEMGGGGELEEYCPNYVEPAVEVYDRLLWLVRYSKANLKKRDLLSENAEDILKSLEEVYELFIVCSVKELENTPLSEEENEALKYIGGTLERLDDMLSNEYNQPVSSAVVSDVANLADVEMFVEIGTGLPNDIIVAIYDNGNIYLARGAVNSYYEFLSEKPLTDEEWHEMIGVEKVVHEEWEFEKINPDLIANEAKYRPPWINSFKSLEDNKVYIPDIEYIIE
ncbi:MAG TPA: DUF3160 domain-containing protein [Defluviitaleaceae bacterium]|nr:DUF3160 domain-containing protein [Defluviitaleaceae bacterium]